MNKAIFLDRDGTINVEKHYLHNIEDFKFLPGAVDALRLLQELEYKLIIITNQSGIARGYYSEKDFEILNSWMIDELANFGINICKVYYCPHYPNAVVEKYRIECECRKPRLGLFYQAVEDYGLDMKLCYAIGDRIRDCSICLKSDCRGFLIGNNESSDIRNAIRNGKYRSIRYAKSLYEAAQSILKSKNKDVKDIGIKENKLV